MGSTDGGSGEGLGRIAEKMIFFRLKWSFAEIRAVFLKSGGKIASASPTPNSGELVRTFPVIYAYGDECLLLLCF